MVETTITSLTFFSLLLTLRYVMVFKVALVSVSKTDAQRWLEGRFGLFGSIWVNDFSRAKKANKKGDWRDPVPR